MRATSIYCPNVHLTRVVYYREMFWKRRKPTAYSQVEMPIEASIQSRLQALEDQVSGLRLALAETQDKVYHWMKRTQARDRVGNGAEDPKGTEAPESENPRIARLLARRRARGSVSTES